MTCPAGSTWSGSACVGTVVVTRVEAPKPRPKKACNSVEDCAARCDTGEAAACTLLGIRYAAGDGVPRDDAKAREYLESACAEKDPQGCYELALSWGDETSKVARYTIACDANLYAACANLGVKYNHGQGVTADPVRARELAEKACTGGDTVGCANLGSYLRTGNGGPKDLDRAVKLSRQACDGNNGQSCARLAEMHRSGEGVAVDLELARRLGTRACDLGYGCNDVAAMYLDGKGGGVDGEKARELFERACLGDDALGCLNLGRIWFRGKVKFETNFAKAAEYLHKACGLGDYDGCVEGIVVVKQAKAECQKTAAECVNWGVITERGYGVNADLLAAIKLYEKACNAREGMGCANAARFYRDGEGVKQDRKRAQELYDRGCKLNNVKACEKAADLRASDTR